MSTMEHDVSYRLTMDEAEAREAKARIEAEQHRVSGLIRQVKRELGEEAESDQNELSDYDQHPADSGSDTFEREKDLGLLDDLEAEYAELQAALERVDAGTYGIDEVTGEPIDPERLAASPAARTNVDVDPRRAEESPHDEAP